MAKKLKFWNVRGWGRKDYDKDSPTYNRYVYPKAACHIYVCAHSRAHASRIMAEHLPREAGWREEPRAAANELKIYGSNCWGIVMKGVEPEIGIWVSQGRQYSDEEIICVWKESDE